VEFAGILAGGANREAAEAWLDFMLGERFQGELPLQMFVMPVVSGATLPEEFTAAMTVVGTTDTNGEAVAPATALSPEEIAENRERWIAEWTETVLR
jgi:thiamine transport system substrate-binding protein